LLAEDGLTAHALRGIVTGLCYDERSRTWHLSLDGRTSSQLGGINPPIAAGQAAAPRSCLAPRGSVLPHPMRREAVGIRSPPTTARAEGAPKARPRHPGHCCVW
jgi:hypothetical protein